MSSRNFFVSIWFVYCSALLYPDIERYTLFNEIFALLGLLLSLDFFYKKYRALTKIELVYFISILYGLILCISSFQEIINTGAYLSLRTMPIFYNVFSFMVGYSVYQYYLRFNPITTNSKWMRLNLFVSLITPWRISPQVFAMFYLKTFKGVFIYLLLFLLINGGSTSITAFIFVGLLYIYKNTHVLKILWSRKFLYICIASFLFLLSLSGGVYQKFIDVGYEDIFGFDVNITWRYMFWVYLYQDVISQNFLTGIGFGTPLFNLDFAPDFLTSDDGSRNTEYTLGTHNSIIFLISRMGLIGVLLITWLHVLIYSKAFKVINKKLRTFSELEMLLLANLMFLNSAFFNVVLESPLYGGLYWVSLGLLYGSIKYNEDELN